MKKLLIIIQIILVAVAIGFAIFWVLHSEGPFEAWLGVATTLLVALELVRQFWPWDVRRDADSRFLRQLESSGDLRDLLNRALSELEKITATDYNQIFLNHQAGYDGRLLLARRRAQAGGTYPLGRRSPGGAHQ
jgi:hypothetical protein